MNLEIQVREREGIRIFDFEGRLTVGEVEAVRERVRALVAEGRPRLIFNLREVQYIDSTGLGALVMCYTAVEKAGGGLKLLHLNRRNIELLVLTKLSTVFEIFDDEQQAVNSFFPNREIRRFDILEFVRRQGEE
ncbi:MAG: STAS domain-containing protein [Acidobacteria bacterium]|nr:STAS domain-containing protein [Acidobacteriota bacterium]